MAINYEGSRKKLGNYFVSEFWKLPTEGYFDFKGSKIELVNPTKYPEYYKNKNAYNDRFLNIRYTDAVHIYDFDDNNFLGVVADKETEIAGGAHSLIIGTFAYDSSYITETNPKGIRMLNIQIPSYTNIVLGNSPWITLTAYKEPNQAPRLFVIGKIKQIFSDDPQSHYRLRVPYEDLTLGRNDLYTYEPTFRQDLYLLKDGQIIPYPIDDVPDVPAESEPSDPDGSLDDSSDPIDFPELPSISINDTGMATLWNPSLSEINALGGFLWSDDILTQLSKMWADPLEMIISLSVVPVQPEPITTADLTLGIIDTGVNMLKCEQYITLDCGSIEVAPYYGSALDFNPYTNYSIFLPFVGVIPLEADDVAGSTLHVKYNIDVFTGQFAAFIKITRDKLDSVLFHFSGNCGVQMPITSNSFKGLYQSIIQEASSVAGGIISGGGAGAVASVLTTTAMNTISNKESVSRSGNLGSNAGMLDSMKPYLIIERPIQSLANDYNSFVGYPSNITSTLGQLSGFTQVESVISNGLTCPQAEQDEIIRLLKEGVYL